MKFYHAKLVSCIFFLRCISASRIALLLSLSISALPRTFSYFRHSFVTVTSNKKFPSISLNRNFFLTSSIISRKMSSLLEASTTTNSEVVGNPFNFSWQQTMLRIKDPLITVPFYERHFGFKLIHK